MGETFAPGATVHGFGTPSRRQHQSALYLAQAVPWRAQVSEVRAGLCRGRAHTARHLAACGWHGSGILSLAGLSNCKRYLSATLRFG